MMNDNIKSFLESGLLERYLVGDTSIAENLEVEHLIESHDEIALAYDELQNNLEIVAKANSVEAPLGVLNKVLKATTVNEPKVITLEKQVTPWYSIAASVAAIIFATSTVYFYMKNQALVNENNVVVEEIFDLRDDIQKNKFQINQQATQLAKLNNPDSKKYLLAGNYRAEDLKTVAYINRVEKTSMIDVVSLPKLPDNKVYQLRAELEDRFVSLGVIEDYQRALKPIPYMEDAVALSIVVEDKNSSNDPNKSDEVAEISLKN